jgi:transcriptional regulator with XRE-family HTH domain
MPTLAELRRAAGLTQVELAQRAGISWSQIQKLEYGQARPTWDTLQGLVSVLGSAVYEVEFTTSKQGKAGRPPKTREEQSDPENREKGSQT